MFGTAASASAPDAPVGVKGPRPAIQRSGAISADDYPASALRDRAEGDSVLRYLVGEDGRVLKCFVERSSGNAALDSTACSLIQRRFRYRPALDAAGRAITEWRSLRHTWSLPSEVPPAQGRPPASD
jgi:protein TonB